ncbi:MAG TPA: hypothetical protein VMU09_04090 [Acidimicrobiales bacterium]|nr:hypothetical protein [Acidimicrobiales bacterium]
MDNLIRLLLEIISRIPWPSESELERIVGLLRDLEAELGLSGNVPPPPGPTNQPAPAPAPDPGPVAETPVDPGFVPPTSPEVAVSPEADNAFAEAAPPADAGT